MNKKGSTNIMSRPEKKLERKKSFFICSCASGGNYPRNTDCVTHCILLCDSTIRAVFFQ